MQKVIISAGGTGGHIFPALAVAKALKARSEEIEILFVGARGKMEMDLIPKHGFDIEGLNISGIKRSFSFSNLKVPFKVMGSILHAVRILKDFRPDVVAGFGGYASWPVLNVAQRIGIPNLIQEQNSYAGWTNKMLGRKADIICVAFPDMHKCFPKDKIVVTGNPVRNDLRNPSTTRQEAFKHFGFDEEQDKKTLLLFGGSLGAKTLNEAMEASSDWLEANADINVIWQMGKLYYDQFKNCKTAQLPNVCILAFIDRMNMAYQISDFVISRAGALTISELCLLAKPAVLVPSPNVAEDHQTKNAMALVKKKSAVMIHDQDVEKELIPAALRWIKDKKLCEELRKNIRKLEKPRATESIVDELLKLMNK